MHTHGRALRKVSARRVLVGLQVSGLGGTGGDLMRDFFLLQEKVLAKCHLTFVIFFIHTKQ
jgi:hypothetical protein